MADDWPTLTVVASLIEAPVRSQGYIRMTLKLYYKSHTREATEKTSSFASPQHAPVTFCPDRSNKDADRTNMLTVSHLDSSASLFHILFLVGCLFLLQHYSCLDIQLHS